MAGTKGGAVDQLKFSAPPRAGLAKMVVGQVRFPSVSILGRVRLPWLPQHTTTYLFQVCYYVQWPLADREHAEQNAAQSPCLGRPSGDGGQRAGPFRPTIGAAKSSLKSELKAARRNGSRLLVRLAVASSPTTRMGLSFGERPLVAARSHKLS